jgi:ABC-type dipeptide/oligopeptide/nickel transport system permease subunit
MVASVILVLVVLIAIFAPELAPHDPARSSLRNILKPPSATYPLGTDDLGRDVLSRLIFASRLSLMASVQAVAIALLIGLPLGLISGYVGGLPGVHAMWAGANLTWHKPILRGDEFTTKAWLKDLIEHDTRFGRNRAIR